MGMTTQKGSGRVALSEINVTPMVDVMLVLLIIFMVTAPMIQQGVDVELPKTETVEIAPDDGKTILTLTADGRVLLGETEIPFEQLEEKIVANAKIQREKVVYLYADRGLKYDLVVRVMAILKKAGVENLGMVTEPLDNSAATPATGTKKETKAK